MLKRSLVIAIILILATAAGAHAAATLTTAPFPGPDISAGKARCLVTNAGTKAGTVTLVIASGVAVLATDGPITLSAGETTEGSSVNLANFSPTTCRITVPSKSRYRGSFSFVNGDVPPTVIPAQ